MQNRLCCVTEDWVKFPSPYEYILDELCCVVTPSDETYVRAWLHSHPVSLLMVKLNPGTPPWEWSIWRWEQKNECDRTAYIVTLVWNTFLMSATCKGGNWIHFGFMELRYVYVSLSWVTQIEGPAFAALWMDHHMGLLLPIIWGVHGHRDVNSRGVVTVEI